MQPGYGAANGAVVTPIWVPFAHTRTCGPAGVAWPCALAQALGRRVLVEGGAVAEAGLGDPVGSGQSHQHA